MPEKKFPVLPVGVDYICDACGVGSIQVHDKMQILADSVLWPHKCDRCGSEKSLPEKYPTVRFERKQVVDIDEFTRLFGKPD